MTISYEPMSDVLTITLEAAPVAQTQMQGTVSVGFGVNGAPVSVAIPQASTLLWEHGGQVSVMMPQATQTVVTQVVEQPVVQPPTQTVVTRVVER